LNAVSGVDTVYIEFSEYISFMLETQKENSSHPVKTNPVLIAKMNATNGMEYNTIQLILFVFGRFIPFEIWYAKREMPPAQRVIAPDFNCPGNENIYKNNTATDIK